MSRRILIAGAGAIAHHHAAAAKLVPGARIAAADPSPAARRDFEAAFPEARTFDDFEEMLADSPGEPGDVAVIAVPPWLHAPLGLAALRAGFDTLCEKPVAWSLDELDDLQRAADETGRKVGDCSVRFTGQPAAVRARQRLQEGALGLLNMVRMVHRRQRARPGLEYQPTSRWFLSKEKSGGGVLTDWTVYDLSMLFDVLRPVQVTIRAAWTGQIDGAADPPEHPVDVESHVAAMMELTLSDGQVVPFLYERANGVNGPELAELSIEGRREGLMWQWLPPYEENAATFVTYEDAGGRVEERMERMAMDEQPHFHHRPLLGFVDWIDGAATELFDMRDQRLQFSTILAIYDVAATGKPIVVSR